MTYSQSWFITRRRLKFKETVVYMRTKAWYFYLLLLLAGFAYLLGGGCVPGRPDAAGDAGEAEYDQIRVFGEVGDTAASLPARVSIDGLGDFSFEPKEIETVREDIFQEGYFSIFDVLVHLAKSGLIEMSYKFDEEMNTHVITSLDHRDGWWYSAYYDGGWPEESVFRMDHYPYKDNMTLRFVQKTERYLNSVYETYREEIRRKAANGGRLVVPEVVLKGRSETLVFHDLEVKAHNMRVDIFKPGVITALDVIITLGEAGAISYDLQWYESLGTAGVVKSYWVNRINEDESYGRCGFVYEAGDEQFRFFRGNHNHIPSDTRVINSPMYVEYFWICI
jgi:hypothetical protein